MKLRGVFLAGATFFLFGCTTQYKTPTFASSDEKLEFPGIADAFQEGKPLDVLLVHGMCTHDGVWANESAAQLYEILGGDATQVKLEKRQVLGSKIELYQQTLATRFGSMRINAIVWSPLTTPLKKQLCYDQTTRAPYCTSSDAAAPYPYHRAKLNQILKDNILNDCLSDAMAYQGRSKGSINKQMQLAILQALGTSGGLSSPGSTPLVLKQLEVANVEKVPLVLITESLGSKVTFDALLALSNNSDDALKSAGTATFDRVTQIFMGANQLPILAMADEDIDSPNVGTLATKPTSALGQLLQERGQRSPKPSSIIDIKSGAGSRVGLPTVVAFSDPNDLLSYPLKESPHRKAEGYQVVDVIVSNAPTILGLVELPDAAHLRYWENPAVKELITCGNPYSTRCR